MAEAQAYAQPHQNDEEIHSSWRVWFVALLLALLWHLLCGILHIDWTHPSQPLQVDINQVDPAKLAAIRNQWKNREMTPLLDRNSPKAKDAPKDARFMSDHNIQVEKEQRAKIENVIPQPGRAGPKAEESRPKEEQKPKPEKQNQTVPKLGNLGVPFRLNEKPPVKEEYKESEQAQHGGDDAGDQAIRDRNLPVGSENMLNAQESVYYSFFARLYEEIGPIWQSRIRSTVPSRRLGPGEYLTSVDVVLDSEGNLIAVHQLQSSGVPEFDQAVQDSWRRIGRFPNPPSGLLKNGEVHTGWTFSVQLDQSLNPDYLPPTRSY
jgi:protein TonB